MNTDKTRVQENEFHQILSELRRMTDKGKQAHDLLSKVSNWLWTHKSREFFDYEAGDNVIYEALAEYFKTYNGELG